MQKIIITSESVNIGHPDKTCDTIADAFLDEALKRDKYAQMAVECSIKDNLLMIYGEATTTAKINYAKIAREVLLDIGYTNKFKIIKKISEQSPEINKATVNGGDVKANDQGIVYGYACKDTRDCMPMPITMAHMLMSRYESWRRTRKENNFYADAKSQVSIEYLNDKPVAIHTILVSVSHAKELSCTIIHNLIEKNVVDVVLAESSFSYLDKSNMKIIINPSGAFTIWGSHSDSGAVGRKLMVDTYGGVGKHGGGAFSSKNATKVDRSGAYYARYVAKNVVANDLADKCEISAAYAIGMGEPIKVSVETFNTNKVPHAEIQKYVDENFDFSPSNIIKELDLLRPIYKATACYGHFGREEFTWEKVKKLKA